MAINKEGKSYRNELKFYINFHEYYVLHQRLPHVLQKDPFTDENNEYFIRSVYFDDIYNSALLEKLAGIEKRKKIRIRMYNHDDRFIRLEVKSKIGEFVHKDSVVISRQQCQQILENDIDFLRQMQHPLLQSLYFEMKTNLLKPVVIVDYVREAYVHPIENIRITFDKDLKSGLYATNILDKDIPTVRALDDDSMIMEVKFNHFLPDHIKNLLQISAKQRSSISKYVLCRKFLSKNIKQEGK